MAVHHPHLLDFSPPPSTVAMEAPPPSFDHGQLLALHVDGTDMLSLGGGLPATHHRVLADDTAAWPPPQGAVPLSLYNYGTAGGSPSSLFSHGHQQFAVPPEAVSLQAPNNHLLPTRFQLRSSKYLGPVQDLLAEFCSLLEGDLHAMNGVSKRSAKAAGGKWDDVAEPSSSSGLWGHPSLSSMDLLELERRKSRLLSMVEEVDRRYRRYREQMRAMEVSFEAVAGAGASQVYTRLALRAMSRHFRCLRDALVAQVRALRKAGAGAANKQDDDYGGAGAGATKGETPRLKVLDQCLRQQRAFQHPAGSIENYPWRPQRGLPERAVAVLRAWLFEHFLHPYPNDVDKHILARQTGLSRSQVSNWFINARVRLWKPMIEDMYTDEVKVKQQQQSEATTTQNPTSAGVAVKPEQNATAGATMGGESHHFRSTTSVGNNPTASMMFSSSIVPETDGGDLHLFSTSSYPTSMHDGSSRHGGAVSLTLGLQQQQQPFAPPMMPHHHQRSSLMLLQGEEEEEPVLLPYSYRDRDRDLTGSQLLHDLAGS